MPDHDAPRADADEADDTTRAAPPADDSTDPAAGPGSDDPDDDPDDAAGARKGRRRGKDGKDGKDAAGKKRRTPLWLETLILLAVALGMALIIKTFFVQAFYIPSASMEPGLVVNDRILVQKVSYWFGGEPQRGDVVVFKDPGGWLPGPETGPQTFLAKGLAKVGLYPSGGHLVKRVIGTPGDQIHCCDDEGHLEVNGVAIDEDDFIRPQPKCDGPMPSRCTRDWDVTVPDDRLFVMGDNRGASADSSDRLCPPNAEKCSEDPFVPEELVVGKVFALVWPVDHARLVSRPDVFADVPDAG